MHYNPEVLKALSETRYDDKIFVYNDRVVITSEVTMFTEEEIQTDPILAFFRFEHLPHKLQQFSKPFADLAKFIVNNYPRNAERTVSLRKLLEAKDAAVRAALE